MRELKVLVQAEMSLRMTTQLLSKTDVMWIGSENRATPEMLGVLTAGVTTLLVGFAEETAFRGILLRGELARRNVYVAMIVSTAGFALLHGVNILGGSPSAAVASQMLDTFVYGLFMAPLALLIGNLIPLIVIHFLWDFVSLAPGQLTSIGSGIPPLFAVTQGIFYPVQIVMTIVAWVIVFVMWRRGRFAKA